MPVNSTSKNARIAGFLYLLLVLAAPFRLLYIPSTLFVHGDASATLTNIAAHDTLFRLGIVSNLFCATLEIFLMLALYRLFKQVDHKLAVLMVVLGVVTTPIDFVNVLNDAAVLMIAQGADFLSAFDKPQREALSMLFLHLHGEEILALEIFWGLWLFPLGALVFRSGFLPRFLGVWLILNGIAYLAESFSGILLPQYAHWVSSVAFPAQFGEVAFMLWILLLVTR